MIFKVKISQILCIFTIIIFASPCQMISSQYDADFNNIEDSRPFEVRLYSSLVKATPEENIIYSPLSIKTCLAMTRMGAVDETALEMDKTLTLSAQNPNDLARYHHDILENYQNSSILSIANKIYFMKGYKIQRPFHDLLTNEFFASADPLDFARNDESAKTINTWVEQQTNNEIKDLVSPDQLNEYSRLVLINAIHFKGEWASKFDVKNTYDASFHLNENLQFDVKMMFQVGNFKNAYMRDLKAYAVEMPYKGSKFSMLIILPWPNTSLSNLEKILNTIPLTNITDRMDDSDVELHMPRFKIDFKVELANHLSNMGMRRMFSDDAKFVKMLEPIEGLKVSSVIHKASIKVNEDGVEAAAATDDDFYERIGPITIKVNRPFYYIIKADNNTKVFEGRINNKFTA